MKKTIQLFMLPFAGGNSLSFMKVARFLDSKIECIPIEYAGRGSRSNESIIENYNSFLKDVCNSILARRDEKIPSALFGYSMGSALAFDIASLKLLNTNPVYCFFCAEGSLSYNNPARKIGGLQDQEFMQKINEMGGVDNRLIEDKNAMDTFLKVIKADFDILAQFDYKNQKVSSNASIVYCPEDDTCVNMDDWASLIDGDCRYYKMQGGHFFVKKYYREVADIINSDLASFFNDKG